MSELDKAIVAYRENPTEENHTKLMRAQREHVDATYRRNADEFIRRTRGK